MTVEEAIKFIQKRNKLTVIEKEILKATWENQTYATVAKNSHLSVGHIKDVAYKLWKQLSEILGEKVNKTNLRLVLQKKPLLSVILTPRIIWRLRTTQMLIQKNMFHSYNRKFRNSNKLKKFSINPALF